MTEKCENCLMEVDLCEHCKDGMLLDAYCDSEFMGSECSLVKGGHVLHVAIDGNGQDIQRTWTDSVNDFGNRNTLSHQDKKDSTLNELEDWVKNAPGMIRVDKLLNKIQELKER